MAGLLLIPLERSDCRPGKCINFLAQELANSSYDHSISWLSLETSSSVALRFTQLSTLVVNTTGSW